MEKVMDVIDTKRTMNRDVRRMEKNVQLKMGRLPKIIAVIAFSATIQCQVH
jgi:hypothetical protein